MRLQMIVVLGLAAACSGGGKKTTTPTGTDPVDDRPTPLTIQTLLGWGLQTVPGGKIELYLEVTDHTGQAKSYPVGDSTRPCAPGRGNGGDIITSLLCVDGGVGSEYRAVLRSNEVIVLRRPIDPSDDPGDIELSFSEVMRLDVPAGAKVSAAP